MNSATMPSIKNTQPLPNVKNVVVLMSSVQMAIIKAMSEAKPRFCDSAGLVGLTVRSAYSDNSRIFATV
ncbi:hypothetical protein D3C81_2246580 [compost metagenome]